MPGYPAIGSPANPIPGELGENDASTIDDGIRVIVKALRDYGVHVISGPIGSRPAASAVTIGRFHVPTDITPRRFAVDLGTAWSDDDTLETNIRGVRQSFGSDRRTFIGAAYNADNGWVRSYVGHGVYHDGANWVAKSYAGNNGWSLQTVNGIDGATRFYSAPGGLGGRAGSVDYAIGASDMQTGFLRLTIAADGRVTLPGKLRPVGGIVRAEGGGLPANPEPGQEAYLFIYGRNYLMRYTNNGPNVGSTYFGWEWVGGAPTARVTEANLTVPSGSIQQFLADYQVACPISAFYEVEVDAHLVGASSDQSNGRVTIARTLAGSSTAVAAFHLDSGLAPPYGGAQIGPFKRDIQCNPGDTLSFLLSCTAGSVQFDRRAIRVRPQWAN